MRVHLVGGDGFIGSHLRAALQARSGARSGYVEARSGARSGYVEARGLSLVAREDAYGVDALVLLHGGRSSPEAVHVELTRRLLDELRPRHALLLSSGEVYGTVPVPFTESGPIAPRSPYGMAKRRTEELVLQYAGRGTVVRAGVIYGPGQRGAMLVPALVSALSRGEPIALSRGEQTRDFLHVKDLVALLLRLLSLDETPPIVNAGRGLEVEVRSVARTVARLCLERTGRDVESCLQLGAMPYREDEPMRYALSPELARSLGWEPVCELEAGLAELVAAAT